MSGLRGAACERQPERDERSRPERDADSVEENRARSPLRFRGAGMGRSAQAPAPSPRVQRGKEGAPSRLPRPERRSPPQRQERLQWRSGRSSCSFPLARLPSREGARAERRVHQAPGSRQKASLGPTRRREGRKWRRFRNARPFQAMTERTPHQFLERGRDRGRFLPSTSPCRPSGRLSLRLREAVRSALRSRRSRSRRSDVHLRRPRARRAHACPGRAWMEARLPAFDHAARSIRG